MKKIVIIGAGGFGREVAQLVKDINKEAMEWEIIGYLDDHLESHGTIRNGLTVLGPIDLIRSNDFQHYYYICSLGDPKTRKMVIERMLEIHPSIQFATLIHPSAIIGDENRIGEGSVICARNVLTTNISIGKYVIINLSCTIGHDTTLLDYTTVLPGVNISGNVSICEGVSMGTNSSVIPGVEIGRFVTIGAGAAVTRSIPEHCTAVGIPARPIKFNQ